MERVKRAIQTEPILRIQNLSKTFELHNLGKRIHAIDNVNLVLYKGEFVGITGKSGSGKSTILKSVYRTYVVSPDADIWYSSLRFGEVNLVTATERQMIYLRQHEIGYVSQFLNVMPRTTARELVKVAILEMNRSVDEAEAGAEQILAHFELDRTLWDSYPATFSGGEKLRLNIARAMVKRPRLLLLDEPTASLDRASKEKVRDLLEQLMQEGTTMLGIFHDLEFMQHLCDREYNMQSGKFCG
jgi:alpha-D-ribose 1-methylphosphonate 5-triphosphate synthase subunit PhnL